MGSKNYKTTTMEKVYQEAQLWYADVNARFIRKYWNDTFLPGMQLYVDGLFKDLFI